YEHAITLEPQNAEVWRLKAVALEDVERSDEALVAANRALALSPDNPDVLNTRGCAFILLERYDEALADFDRALALDPAYVKALWNRANLSYDTFDRYEAALNDLDRALTYSPDDTELLAFRSAVLLALERFDEGLAALDQIHERTLDRPEAW